MVYSFFESLVIIDIFLDAGIDLCILVNTRKWEYPFSGIDQSSLIGASVWYAGSVWGLWLKGNVHIVQGL